MAAVAGAVAVLAPGDGDEAVGGGPRERGGAIGPVPAADRPRSTGRATPQGEPARPGWTVRKQALAQDLAVGAVDGTARVVPDDRKNAYHARSGFDWRLQAVAPRKTGLATGSWFRRQEGE